MRYRMTKQLLLSGDIVHILDEQGDPVYLVDGMAMHIRGRLSFLDMEGHELLYLREKIAPVQTVVHLFLEGQVLASIGRTSLSSARFFVDIQNGDRLMTKGNVMNYAYRIVHGTSTVCAISTQGVLPATPNRRIGVSEEYGVDIVTDAYPHILILAAVTVIELMALTPP
jgi:uncharacterized protein YxjI